MAGPYNVSLQAEAALGGGALGTALPWTSLTTEAMEFSSTRGRSSEFDQFQAATGMVKVKDTDRRYDPLYSAGLYGGSLLPNVPLRVYAEHNTASLTETFTGSDGATPTGWTDSGTSGAGASVGINSNRLRFVTGTTAFGLGRIRYGTALTANIDLTCTVDIQALSEQYVNVYVRCGSSFVDNQLASGYAAVVDVAANLLAIYEIDAAGATTQIASGAVTWTAAIWNVRVLACGACISAKAWTTTEPDAWTVSIQDTTFSGTSIGLRVTGGNNTTSDTIYIDDLTTYPVYPRFFGYVDSWDYDPRRNIGFTTIPATDGFKIIAQKKLPQSVYETVVLADSPHFYWRLGETGSVAADSSGNDYDGTYDTAAASQDASTIRPFGEGSLNIEQSNFAAVRGTDQARVTAEPRTVEMWLQSDGELATGASANAYALFWSGHATAGNRIEVYYQRAVSASDDKQIWAFGGGNRTSWVVPGGLDDSQPHHVVIAMASAAKSLYIDGHLVASNTTAVDDTSVGLSGVWIGVPPGFASAGILGQWIGRVSDVALYDTALTASDALAHYEAATQPWYGDTTGARIGRILDLVGWPATLRDIDDGEVLLGNADLDGSNALAYLQLIAASEQGRLFMSNDGKVTFQGAAALRANTTAEATFSDDGADNPYLYGSLRYGIGWRHVVNDASVQRKYGLPQTATDTTSTEAYGTQTKTLSGLLMQTDVQSRGRAEQLVYRYKDPQVRVDSWTVNPQAKPAQWQQHLALELGDHVELEVKPANVGTRDAIQMDLEMLTERATPSMYEFTLVGSPRDPNVLNYLTFGGTLASQSFGTGVFA